MRKKRLQPLRARRVTVTKVRYNMLTIVRNLSNNLNRMCSSRSIKYYRRTGWRQITNMKWTLMRGMRQ